MKILSVTPELSLDVAAYNDVTVSGFPGPRSLADLRAFLHDRQWHHEGVSEKQWVEWHQFYCRKFDEYTRDADAQAYKQSRRRAINQPTAPRRYKR